MLEKVISVLRAGAWLGVVVLLTSVLTATLVLMLLPSKIVRIDCVMAKDKERDILVVQCEPIYQGDRR